MLCIGGPLMGQKRAVLHGRCFSVPIADPLPVGPMDLSAATEIMTVEFVNYRSGTFGTPQGYVEFWVPEGQTPLETITMLLEAYERSPGEANAMSRGKARPTDRVPVMQYGCRVGTLPPDFDPSDIKSRSFLYDPRPGDFRREGDVWIVGRTMGASDIDMVPGFRRETTP